MKWRLLAVLSLLAIATGARADEFRLKDGSKIVGTIVGYEGDSFKVQTAYGFALIRKDSIAEIIPGEPKKPDPANTPSVKPADEPAPAKPPATPPVSPAPETPLNAAVPEVSAAPLPPPPAAAPASPAVPARAAAAPAPPKPMTPVPAVKPTVVVVIPPITKIVGTPAFLIPPPEPTSEPAPLPQPVRELVRGNLYINQTYGFQMYKPPDWELIEDASKALPNAIGALGTRDETSLLVIGHDLMDDPIEAHAAATERALGEIYEDYRPLLSRHITVAGLPAIENRSRGTLGDHNWSVIVVTFAHGKEAFTILGMTYADSDLIQIQENVIARAISSLQFTSPQ